MPTDTLQWTTIDDFTPGIVSKAYKGAGAGSGFPARKGAAQVTNTYSCIALPSGGLAPLPKMVATFPVPAPDVDANALLGRFMVNGMMGFGPIGPPAASASGIPDDIFIGVEYLRGAPATPNRIFTYYRLNLDTTGTPADTLVQIISAQQITADQYVGMSFGISRMNPTSPYLTAGNPVIVTSWSPPAFAADKHVWVFPNPNAPGTTAVADIANNRSGSIIAHQNRIILLEDITTPFGARSGDQIPSNEQISYNDPANSFVTATPNTTIGTQNTVLVAEYPNGYGAWGSISAGELFLIKSQGGGVIVSGDINSPTVVRLPGVVSTMGLGCRAASTPNGLFYYSRFNGLYNWRGSDTASKVSNNLEDDFIFYNGGPDKLLNQQVQVQEWADWVLTTNGYLYDTNTDSFWRLDNPATYTPQWYCRSFYGEVMYAVPASFSNAGGLSIIRSYNRLTPASTYSWQSHPIAASMERIIDIRELVLLAQGAGSVVVTLTALDGTTQAETFNITNTTQPQRLRLPTEIRGYNVVVRIVSTATASGPAPIVYSLSLGTREQVKAVTT